MLKVECVEKTFGICGRRCAGLLPVGYGGGRWQCWGDEEVKEKVGGEGGKSVLGLWRKSWWAEGTRCSGKKRRKWRWSGEMWGQKRDVLVLGDVEMVVVVCRRAGLRSENAKLGGGGFGFERDRFRFKVWVFFMFFFQNCPPLFVWAMDLYL